MKSSTFRILLMFLQYVLMTSPEGLGRKKNNSVILTMD